jgi:ribosomal-protein-alanine N-acetyltransferase
VRVSNEGAIKLYETLGFRSQGIRRGYYTDNREDALIMWRDSASEEAGRARKSESRAG